MEWNRGNAQWFAEGIVRVAGVDALVTCKDGQTFKGIVVRVSARGRFGSFVTTGFIDLAHRLGRQLIAMGVPT